MIAPGRHAHTIFMMLSSFIDTLEKADGAARFTAGGFMDLSMEKLYYTDSYGNKMYSIAHYGVQNGDLMADPQMEFSIDRQAEKVIPYTFQNDYMGAYHSILKEHNGKLLYSVSRLKELDEFLWQWLKNIEAQGFTADCWHPIG